MLEVTRGAMPVDRPFPWRRLPRRDAQYGPDALTYSAIGATVRGPLPAGYRHVRRAAVIGRGRRDFDRAVDELMTWQLHERSGLAVRAPARVTEGAVAWMGAVVGPLRLGFRCKVVVVVDDLRRKGFAYGTLPGHPESGEEAFVVVWRDDDVVELQLTAFSREAAWWSRAGAPIGRLAQRVMTDRYLMALGSGNR